MNLSQFDTINLLFRLTFQVGDHLGNESSDPAQLLLVSQPSLEESQAYFPEHTLESLPRESWAEYLKDTPPLAEMTEILRPYPLTYGIYRQDDVSWWICAFWQAQAGLGTNLLFRAHRVET